MALVSERVTEHSTPLTGKTTNHGFLYRFS